jgi:hypothetical protein
MKGAFLEAKSGAVALDLSDPDHPDRARPELFLHTPSNEVFPAVSPDGRWIAIRLSLMA